MTSRPQRHSAWSRLNCTPKGPGQLILHSTTAPHIHRQKPIVLLVPDQAYSALPLTCAAPLCSDRLDPHFDPSAENELTGLEPTCEASSNNTVFTSHKRSLVYARTQAGAGPGDRHDLTSPSWQPAGIQHCIKPMAIALRTQTFPRWRHTSYGLHT